MPSVTLQVSLAGPADNAGTCQVLYEITEATDVVPEIFVVKYTPPGYKGGTGRELWQHVAYADELTTVGTTIANQNQTELLRKASTIVQYTSLENANTAIASIRAQIQRLMNELTTLENYTSVQSWTISSDPQ